MHPEDLADLHPDGPHRVERCHRILRNQPDLGTAHGAQATGGPRCDVDVAEEYRAALDAAAFREQSQDRVRDGRLARTRLADECDDLALADIEAHVVHDFAPPRAGGVRDAQAVDAEDGHRVLLPSDWLMRLALSTTITTMRPGRVVSHQAVAT